ncbi:MAG: NUDIX hydrolase [Paracoccaceae bacterium]
MPGTDPAAAPDHGPVRDAATVILIRDRGAGPSVLMGQRGQGASFMPSKYVFPGGAVDAADRGVLSPGDLDAQSATRLCIEAEPGIGPGLAAAAIRELCEETGQMLARPGFWDGPATGVWSAFAERGRVPDPLPLSFVFRAITPPGRTRRFDARFFLADADALATDADDFSGASGELSHLHWVPLAEARALNLPFITEIVLAEVAHRLAKGDDGLGVPFFDNRGPAPLFRRLA